jgi:hypothetical protein
LLWKPEGAAKRPRSKTGWNQSSLAKQWRPNPAEVRCRAATSGHEIKLAGETGEACGRVTLPNRSSSRKPRRSDGNCRIRDPIHKRTYVTKWYGRSAECRGNPANCPATCGFWLRVVRGCGVLANFADKSQACLVRLTGSEGDLSRRVNCYASYAGFRSGSHL